ncbi:Uncharacterised protein [Mycobacteroides abscessus subsp. abscessus]|nr:Uncharacterised protein [Mycobacteroides abscessus subsp. abscessus]
MGRPTFQHEGSRATREVAATMQAHRVGHHRTVSIDGLAVEDLHFTDDIGRHEKLLMGLRVESGGNHE